MWNSSQHYAFRMIQRVARFRKLQRRQNPFRITIASASRNSSNHSSNRYHCQGCCTSFHNNENYGYHRQDVATKRHYSFPATAAAPQASSSIDSKDDDLLASEEEQNGAWIVLSALEKAKEAELVSVSKLVSMLEQTLKDENKLDTNHHESDKSTCAIHPNRLVDSISLPNIVERAKNSAESCEGDISDGITVEDVRILMQATRHGKTIGLKTVLALIEGVTCWLWKHRPDSKLVSIPPLREDQTLTVVGDLHGSLSDLATVLEVTPGTQPSEKSRLLFNGDLADRGEHGIETIVVVCALCLAYPKHVFINRGNHEDLALSVAYGLLEELRTKYGSGALEPLTNALDAFFRALPIATVIENDALIVHAGPPPPSHTSQHKLANLLSKNQHCILNGKGYSRTIVDSVGMVAPHVKEGQEILEALMWSDPAIDEAGELVEKLVLDTKDDNNEEEPIEGWLPNPSRGAGWQYDATTVRSFLESEGLSRLVRSHEAVQKGCVRYEIPRSSNNNTKSCNNPDKEEQPMELFTVFSASKYPCKEGFNQGAILALKANGQHQVVRYSTEDDDPIGETTNANNNKLQTKNHSSDHHASYNTITLATIRTKLFKAIRNHEGCILRNLNAANSCKLPFDTVLDILINSLNLHGSRNNLKTKGSKRVLAKALNVGCSISYVHIPSFSEYISQIASQERSKKATSRHPKVATLFEQLDKNQDGYISRSEWLENATRKIAMGAKNGDKMRLDAIEDIRELLDSNKDDRVSQIEWEQGLEGYADDDDDDEFSQQRHG